MYPHPEDPMFSGFLCRRYLRDHSYENQHRTPDPWAWAEHASSHVEILERTKVFSIIFCYLNPKFAQLSEKTGLAV